MLWWYHFRMRKLLAAILILLSVSAAYASDGGFEPSYGRGSAPQAPEPQQALQQEPYISWEPSIGIEAGYKADGLQRFVSSSFYAELDIDLLALGIGGRHTVSLPVSVAYSSEGDEHSYERKQAEAITGFEARYAYRLTELFSLGIGAGMRFQWHLGTKYLSMSAGGSMIPAFRINDWLWITVPVSMYGSRNDWSLTIGAGASFRFSSMI